MTEGLVPDLSDCSVVVTGAAGRLGPVWISALLAAGARVEALVAPGSVGHPSLRPFHALPQVTFHECDVTDRQGLERIATSIYGSVATPDVLVANAGIDYAPGAYHVPKRVEDVRSNDFMSVFDVNVGGLFKSVQVFGRRMADAGHGSIVLIGSLYASVAPDPGLYDHLDPPFLKPPAYGASKAAVVQLSKTLATIWGKRGVRVNVLSPGGLGNDQDKEFRRKYESRVPLGRMAMPHDLGGPLLFLASDQSRYVTGINLQVDGGFTAL